MYELIQVAHSSYYIQSSAKIGLVKLNETDVCLIDSGNDKEAGRKVRQILDANNWHLVAIYNTHSNADHIGGNQYLQNQTGCKIFAPGIECDMTRHLLLEPSFLYGGHPPKDLQHKFLMAKESDAEYLTESCLPKGLEAIQLPGHFFNMIGFRNQDGVVYFADCLSSKETLEKYQVSFIYDVGAYLKTLEEVKKMTATIFIPSHAEPTKDIVPLAELNIDKVLEIGNKIVSICLEPKTFEEVLKQIFIEYNLTMTFEQYALVGSTIKSYLSWLKDSNRIEYRFENNLMLWQSK